MQCLQITNQKYSNLFNGAMENSRKLGLMFIEIVLNTEKYLVKPETAIVMESVKV